MGIAVITKGGITPPKTSGDGSTRLLAKAWTTAVTMSGTTATIASSQFVQESEWSYCCWIWFWLSQGQTFSITDPNWMGISIYDDNGDTVGSSDMEGASYTAEYDGYFYIKATAMESGMDVSYGITGVVPTSPAVTRYSTSGGFNEGSRQPLRYSSAKDAGLWAYNPADDPSIIFSADLIFDSAVSIGPSFTNTVDYSNNATTIDTNLKNDGIRGLQFNSKRLMIRPANGGEIFPNVTLSKTLCFACWICFSSLTNGTDIVAWGKDSDGYDRACKLGLRLESNHLYVFCGETQISVLDPEIDTWYHIFYGYDWRNNTQKRTYIIYVNGKLVKTGTASGNDSSELSNSGMKLSIGGGLGTTADGAFSGYIKDVRIFNGSMEDVRAKIAKALSRLVGLRFGGTGWSGGNSSNPETLTVSWTAMASHGPNTLTLEDATATGKSRVWSYEWELNYDTYRIVIEYDTTNGRWRLRHRNETMDLDNTPACAFSAQTQADDPWTVSSWYWNDLESYPTEENSATVSISPSNS